MTPDLLGVILGGCIGIAGAIIVAAVDWRKWKLDRRAKHLGDRRNRLEQVFREVDGKILEGMSKDSFDIDAISSIIILCPKSVSTAFDEMMTEKTRSPENLREHRLKISLEMKSSLASIDSEIQSLYE